MTAATGDKYMRLLMPLRHCAILMGVLACAGVQAQTPPPSGIYTCVDAKGRKLTSDRPIAECLDREQKVLNPSGTVRTMVGPTLTSQERAQREAKLKQETDARARVLEERLRERALLLRYPSREAHDKERTAALAQVTAVVQAATKRVDELLLERRSLDQEMEFYKKDPGKAPPALRRQIDDIVQSIAVQKRFAGEQDIETRRITARFDEELALLTVLWQAQASAKPTLANVKKAP